MMVNKMSGVLTALFVLITKSTTLLSAIKLLKFGKPLITIISILISAILYGITLGPLFGIGLILMMFIHEMGHVIAIRAKGYEASAMVFIPFLGAAVFAPKSETRNDEAAIGFGGPFVGSIAALACLGLWYILGQTSELLLLISYVGVSLNLFNLIPISPLDGGRITQAVGNWFKYIGLAALVLFTVAAKQPELLLIWILVLDGFTFQKLWLRPCLALILDVCMTGLLLFGYGSSSWISTAVDIFLASIFVLLIYLGDQRRSKNEKMEIYERPYSKAEAIKWFARYIGSLVVLVPAFVFITGHLPKM